MNLYLDASALVKLYLQEEGREEVRAAVNDADGVFISLVGYAEARAALSRGRRTGRLDVRGYRDAVEAFERDWQRNTPIEVPETLVRLAGDLAEKHSLRGFDAIHLASAIVLQGELGEAVTFSAADNRLLAAALAEGLLLLVGT